MSFRVMKGLVASIIFIPHPLPLLTGLFWPPPASAGIIEEFNQAIDGLQSGIQSRCALLLNQARSRLVGARFREAISTNGATEVAVVSDYQVGDLAARVWGLVLGKTFNWKYVSSLFQGGDRLFCYDGRLFRWRPANSSIAIVPRGLERDSADAFRFDVSSIRKSWLVLNLYPSWPEFRDVEDLISTEHSRWSKDGPTFKYESQLSLGSAGYLNLFVKILPAESLFWVKERLVDALDVDSQPDRFGFFAEQAGTDLADLFLTNRDGAGTKIAPGPETVEYLRKISQVPGLFFRY